MCKVCAPFDARTLGTTAQAGGHTSAVVCPVRIRISVKKNINP